MTEAIAEITGFDEFVGLLPTSTEFDRPLAGTGTPVENLTEVLGAGRLVVYYQPIVEMGTGRLEAVEALARWQRDDGQVLAPVDFLPSVTRAGAMPLLDALVLADACAQVVEWRRRRGSEQLELHANVSPEALVEGFLAERVAAVCEHSGLPCSAMWLEVTEGSLISDLPAVAAQLAQVRMLGAHVAVDDFGTGFATLAYAKALPLDGIKIDRSFVTNILSSRADVAVVRSVVKLAQDLSAKVVVEGVETAAEESLLVELGVRLGQGYYYGRPSSAPEAITAFDPDALPAEPEVEPCAAALPHDEEARLQTLISCGVLDTEPESDFDSLTALAAELCGTPIALVSLVDRDRQWFKSSFGFDTTDTPQTPRDIAFCAHAILHPNEATVVADALEDDRFRHNPFVVPGPGIRFYAGIPLVVGDGHPVGTLCVVDTRPRHLDEKQLRLLRLLADQVTAQLELRFVRATLRAVLAGVDR